MMVVPQFGSLPYVLIRDASAATWLLLDKPSAVIRAVEMDKVRPAIREVETLCRLNGWHAAGFVAYEASAAFDGCLRTHLPSSGLPLVWFGLFDHVTVSSIPSAAGASFCEWQPSTSEQAYIEDIRRIRALIEAGDTYQVNYTTRLGSSCGTEDLMCLLSERNGPYGVLIECKDWAIVSGSPELFFSMHGGQLVSKPMKGTRPRGLTLSDDIELKNELASSEKDRAENLMIVDMVRNDMGRIAVPGSVKVTNLFDIEKYQTVWQMTSTVECQTDASLDEMLAALFPPASITGAPKKRAMEIISELETSPRGIYTGTIGLIRPDGSAQFNVAIRTAAVEKHSGNAEYGVGGGIVWDSEADDEWKECLVKARALNTIEPEFDLLETLKWTLDQGFFLLERHVARMKDSAAYFDFGFDEANMLSALDKVVEERNRPTRVRILLDRHGKFEAAASDIPAINAKPTAVTLAKNPIASSNRFLYHKTTHRSVYESALASCPGFDDVLLWNERGELTESTIANLAVEIDGALFTPPVACGLLAGTLRADMIEEGLLNEQILTVDELDKASRIFLLNSVRGLYEVQYYHSQETRFI